MIKSASTGSRHGPYPNYAMRFLAGFALVSLYYSRVYGGRQLAVPIMVAFIVAVGFGPARWFTRQRHFRRAMGIYRQLLISTKSKIIAITAIGIVGVAGVTFWQITPIPPGALARKTLFKALSAFCEIQRPASYIHPDVIEDADLPLIAIELSDNDLAHFAHLYDAYLNEDGSYNTAYYQSHNQWRKAKLKYRGETFRARIRSHGQQPDGHKNEKWISLAIKLRDNKHIYHSRRFNLIIYWRIQDTAHQSQTISDVFGVSNQEDRMVRVRINDWEDAVYFFEYPQKDQYMEAKGLSTWIRPNDDEFKSLIQGAQRAPLTHDNLGVIEASLSESIASRGFPQALNRQIVERYMTLNNHVLSQDPKDFDQYFDLDYIASFEAARLLGGYQGHGAYSTNFIVYYDTSSGLFYPAFHRDWYIDLLSNRRVVEAHTYGPGYYPFTDLLRRNERIRHATYAKLWQFLKDKDSVVEASKRFLYDTGFRNDRMLPRWVRQLVPGQANPHPSIDDSSYQSTSLYKNAILLRRYLAQSKPLIQYDIAEDASILSITPSSMAPLKLHQIASEIWRYIHHDIPVYVEDDDGLRSLGTWRSPANGISRVDGPSPQVVTDLAMSNSLSLDLTPVPRTYYFVLRHGKTSLDFEHLRHITLRNDVTNQVLSDVVTELFDSTRIMQRISQIPVEPRGNPLNDWIAAHPSLSFIQTGDRTLTIPKGVYFVSNTIVLPKGIDVCVEAGVTIQLASDISIIGNGSFEVRGTRERPVVIRASNPQKPFGTVAFVGNRTSRCSISYLNISGGNEAYLQGVHYSGSLSLYKHEFVHIDHCEISDGYADDGLNVKYTNVSIKDSTFVRNAADQVDLDHCEGIVERCRFGRGVRSNDQNGDGLDISRGPMLVRECTFMDFDDKGISAGENSDLIVQSNIFNDCFIGIAVKDSSRAYLNENRFGRNTMDIYAYKKKSIWSSGSVTVFDQSDSNSDLTLFGDRKAVFSRATDWPKVNGDLTPNAYALTLSKISRQAINHSFLAFDKDAVR